MSASPSIDRSAEALLNGKHLVRDWMSNTVVSANLNDGLHQTRERMMERDIRHMPVLDDMEQLVGIISDRDIRRPDTLDVGGVSEAFRIDNTTKVHEVMTAPAAHVNPSTPLQSALTLIGARGFGAVPVVDEDLRVVGMLSAWDLLRAFRACLA